MQAQSGCRIQEGSGQASISPSRSRRCCSARGQRRFTVPMPRRVAAPPSRRLRQPRPSGLEWKQAFIHALVPACGRCKCIKRKRQGRKKKTTNLVEEDVLPVASLCGEILQHPVRRDAVLQAELLPELHADCANEKEMRLESEGNTTKKNSKKRQRGCTHSGCHTAQPAA